SSGNHRAVQRRLDQAGEHFRVASRQLARPDAVAQESPVTLRLLANDSGVAAIEAVISKQPNSALTGERWRPRTIAKQPSAPSAAILAMASSSPRFEPN